MHVLHMLIRHIWHDKLLAILHKNLDTSYKSGKGEIVGLGSSCFQENETYW